MRKLVAPLAVLLVVAALATTRDLRGAEAKFEAEVLAALRSESPERTFARVGPLEIQASRPDGEPDTLYLQNVYRDAPQDEAERREWIRSFVRAFAAPVQERLSPADRPRLLPVIRDDGFVEQGRTGGKAAPLAERLVADLWVLYVLDYPDRVQYLVASDLDALELSAAELRELAVANLSAKVSEVTVKAIGPLHFAELDGTYESSLLLLEPFWAELAAEVGPSPVAAVPTRSLLLFASSADEEAVSRLREGAKRFASEAGYPVSRQLVRRDGAGWKPFP
jgi:uncharacterized protein YtpQ (UPF0354 family)